MTMGIENLFWTHIVFLLFVTISVYAQALTGFALALILLGLIGVTNLIPLTDAVNASTLIGLCTSWAYLYRRKALRIESALVPTLIASAVGIVAGALLLFWLADTAYQALRLILGLSIVACALSLWRAAKPLATRSSPVVYALTGGISGVLGGMFSASGPPLVYLMYRQPMTQDKIRESLMLIFGFGTVLRLAVVIPSGQLSFLSVQLAIEALPIIFAVTYFAVRHPSPLSPRLLKGLICAVLIGTGVSMGVSAAFALLKATT